jgi:hypothetical protein
MPSVTELSGYPLDPIREGSDFTLYRGRQHGNPSPGLVIALSAEQPSPQSLRRREREIKTLLAAFDRVVTSGRPELVLVSGYSRHRGHSI